MSNRLTCTDITNLTRGNGIRSGEGNAVRTGGSVQIFEELSWVCFQMLKTRGKKDSPRRLTGHNGKKSKVTTCLNRLSDFLMIGVWGIKQ